MGKLNAEIAVITRTRNRPLLLPRAAESVLGQKAGDLVWVVVNDGGASEDVERVVQDFRHSCKHEAIAVHNETSLGMEAAANIGIRSCHSDYVIIHDDDDTWEPGFLAACLEFLQKRNNYKGVISLTMTVEERIEGAVVKRLDRYPFNSRLKSVDLSHIAIRNQFPPISFLFSRTVYDALGGFSEHMPILGDWDFNLRFLMQADIGLVPEYLANHHIRTVNLKADDEYGNTVVSGLRSHIEHESRYRHARYREDLARKEVGLGHLLMSGKQFQLLGEEPKWLEIVGNAWRKIQKVARKLGIR